MEVFFKNSKQNKIFDDRLITLSIFIEHSYLKFKRSLLLKLVLITLGYSPCL
jgi:hypothetical protein